MTHGRAATPYVNGEPCASMDARSPAASVDDGAVAALLPETSERLRAQPQAPRKRGSDEPGRSSRNITDDPELRYTQSGAALAGFTVAVSHRSKHNGEWQDVNDGFFRRTA
ncbi:MAG: single-stranded DNA-binding protein [Candidatus Limnocylindria bacterium]